MIPVKPLPAQITNWQQLWRDSLRDPLELLEMLGLTDFSNRISAQAGNAFAFRVPRGFAAKMRHGDIHDPLLRQVLPLTEEEQLTPGFAIDAVGDLMARGATGVLHKYKGRALLVTTGSCAVNCRYCFRRHFPYADETAAAGQWREAVEYLRADASIHEVILSGGDPLSLTTPKLALLTDALKTLPQLKRLRLHTRLPVVLPERVDAELLKWLSELPWPVTMVIHANHGNELGSDVGDALLQLRQTGTTLLNQSVLLAGVNDNANVLQSLSEALHQHGVLPYYLHQLDRVQGAGHFSVPDADAIALHRELMAALPGYLVPKLVREMAGEPNKSPLYESAIVF
ncbi:EF-P beta-lysylation protein EpmB [Arenimonas sp.]|jgi:EF-P beta-lysylation protein EpmB|uniref:EF-P beta-lysylation protein EpmB n=1 Tax=Arenimonas sp. TaxID=1872635 RepID=UPI0037C17418